jgi:tRNA pseudouridine55 synthase
MDGILIIDKPAGFTSHDVVAKARRILKERRIGHTGTLDPFATGVLVLLIGRATRLSQFITAADKEYEATIRLGFATDTGDRDGAPLSSLEGSQNLNWSTAQIRDALNSLTGNIQQLPPMYSAKKRGGQKLYELARRGVEVERDPINVTVQVFEPAAGDSVLTRNEDGTVDLRVRVNCSSGTYVRVLAEDFGKALGVGAHLSSLRRTRSGQFSLKEANTLDHLQQIVDEGALGTILLKPEAALSMMPFAHLSDEDASRARNGVAVRYANAEWIDGEDVGILDSKNRLIGVGRFDSLQESVRPRVILATED